jgi:hypothetical protein
MKMKQILINIKYDIQVMREISRFIDGDNFSQYKIIEEKGINEKDALNLFYSKVNQIINDLDINVYKSAISDEMKNFITGILGALHFKYNQLERITK